MYLKYGNYQHASGEAAVAISKTAVFTEAGIARGIRERWTINGRLHAADQASLSAALDALQAAYRLQAQDVGFYFDSGQPSNHVIRSAQTNGGVRVVGPPSFPEGQGAEYSTFRSYIITLEAEWLQFDAGLLAWNETLDFTGGGPQFVFLEPITGLPQKQLLKQCTTFKVTQSGEATGYLGYPTAAPPLWPDAEHIDKRRLDYELPKRKGPPGSPTYTEYRITWNYSFEDAGPLVGTPTPWPIQ
jgi:hypothetical protein